MSGSIEPGDLVEYYRARDESLRLRRGEGLVEFDRTQELLRRVLAPANRIADVGGGDGVHAEWLAADGHEVVLVDLVPEHVARATRKGLTAQVADARSLPFADASFDVVLLLGPLYHLSDVDDRSLVLSEAKRVLKSGGLLVAAAINRAAVLVDAVRKGVIAEPRVQAALERIARLGCDASSTGTAAMYFHGPEGLVAEVGSEGFVDVRLVGVEGPAWALIPPDAGPEDPAVEHARVVAALADGIDGCVSGSSHLLAFALRP